MCVICISTATVVSLLAPTQTTTTAPVQSIKIVEKQYVQEYNSSIQSNYKFTNQSCSKSDLNKIKDNFICLENGHRNINGKIYKWAIIDLPVSENPTQNTSKTNVPKTNIPKTNIPKTNVPKTNVPKTNVPTTNVPTTNIPKTNIPTTNTPKTESVIYSFPSQPSANIEACKIKENNSNRQRWSNSALPTGFPGFSHTQKMGTVKWALIPLDFSDLPGDENFKLKVNDQMTLLSNWFNTVSDGKFNVEWVVQDKLVRLPNPSNDYKIERSDNLDRVPNGLKLWNDAMTQSDKVFDFTGIQTVNFILPNGQTIIKESLQGFPWDAAVKNFVTNEGSVSSFSIPGNFFDQLQRQYWSYWAHEFGHSMGLPHVGSSREPNAFQGLDIMGSQDGESKELSGWLRFVSGWLDDEKIYCQQPSALKDTEITLMPLNESGKGIKMVVVPVSETKAVIVESRRESKFSCIMPSKRNGVLTYIYDATLSHGENFLQPIVPSGRMPERSFNCPVQEYPNPILYKNDKIVVEGITIEIIDNLKYDKIRINKN